MEDQLVGDHGEAWVVSSPHPQVYEQLLPKCKIKSYFKSLFYNIRKNDDRIGYGGCLYSDIGQTQSQSSQIFRNKKNIHVLLNHLLWSQNNKSFLIREITNLVSYYNSAWVTL